MKRHGWTLLFHDCLIDQLRRLHNAAQRAQRSDPTGFASNANVKLFHALSRLMLDVIPQDPSRDEYRQGGTLGPRYRHWRRTRIGRRFRLFFRYDARANVIVYTWVNDQSMLHSSGSKTDPNAVVARMLARGNPPDLPPPDPWATGYSGSDNSATPRHRPGNRQSHASFMLRGK